ncbi:MAG: aminotransferase class I/II-fold pyridoxal phosphate-dependent enzyme [Chloroflexota bacterium]
MALQLNLDTPAFAVSDANRIAVDRYLADMMAIPASRMFEIKEALAQYKRTAGDDAVTYDASQGDGGASLPGVPVEILDRAYKLQVDHGTGYDKPFGTPLFRKAAVEDYWGLDAATGWGPENVIFTQGGRDGLQKAYKAMMALGNQQIGDALVVSRVPWISYNWGPYDVGLNVLRAPGRPEEGWRYTPEGIRASAAFAEQNGRKVAGIVITSPDNPTGRTISVDEQVLLAKTALEAGYPFVLFDWIYHWVSDSGPNDINKVLLAFTPAERDRLIFLDGITKSLGASNIRSAHLVAGKEVVKYINSRASHAVIPSFYAQAVAIAAYQMGFARAAAPILDACRESRGVMREVLGQTDVPHILGDGYYAFIDITRYIEAAGMADSAELGAWLGRTYGVTVVPGAYFSDAGANWVRFSYALPADVTRGALDRFFKGLNSLL